MPFDIARSGLTSAISKLRATANNVANVATTGFSQSRVQTVDAVSASGGAGVRIAAITPTLAQGNPEFTDYSFDFAISGQGYFALQDGGGKSYARNGAFRLDRNGNIVNSRQQKLTGFLADNNGNITSQTGDLRIAPNSGVPRATSQIDVQANLDASASVPTALFNANDPSTYNLKVSAPMVDSLGTSHNVDMYFSKTATPGTWNVQLVSNGNAISAPATLTFNGGGVLSAPASGTVTSNSFDPGNGASPMSLTVQFAKTTQYAMTSSVNSVSHDGQSQSALAGVAVNSQGILSARYANGTTSTVGQIALANFANPQALHASGNSTLTATIESGAEQLGAPGSGNLGVIQAGALEASNVNLEEQLLSLKTARYEYAANAKVIKANNDMLGYLFKEKA